MYGAADSVVENDSTTLFSGWCDDGSAGCCVVVILCEINESGVGVLNLLNSSGQRQTCGKKRLVSQSHPERRSDWCLHFKNRRHAYCSVAVQTWGAVGNNVEVPPTHTCAYLCACVCVCLSAYAHPFLEGLVGTPSVGVSEPLHGHWTQTLCSHRVRSSRHTAVRADWSMSSAFHGVKVLAGKRCSCAYVVSSSYLDCQKS